MVSDRKERIRSVLRDLKSSTPDIESSAIISSSGIVIASDLPRDIEEKKLGEIITTMMSVAGKVASELHRGQLEQVLVRCDKGNVILVPVGMSEILVSVTKKDARLGLVFLEMKRTAKQLHNIMQP